MVAALASRVGASSAALLVANRMLALIRRESDMMPSFLVTNSYPVSYLNFLALTSPPLPGIRLATPAALHHTDVGPTPP